MFRWQTAVGIVFGLVLAAIVMGLITSWRGHTLLPPSGPMLTEPDGTIRSVVLQYARGSDAVFPTYRDFLRQLPADVSVYIACPEEADFRELLAGVGSMPQTVKPIYTHHPQTTWSRDRWVALLPPRDQPSDPWTLLAPRGELNAEIWPARAGDNLLAGDIAKALGLHSRKSDLYFDGGDFLADGDVVFATPAVISRNVQVTVKTREELAAKVEWELKRRVVLMDDVPDHHAGMYMMAAGAGGDGRRIMVVADVGWGEKLSPKVPANGAWPGPWGKLKGGPDFSAEARAKFDAAARHASEQGYKVVRIPVAPARESKAYITYVNVIIDQRDGKRVVYLPVFKGAEAMNAAARGVWESIGYEVREVACGEVFENGGTLHCLVTPVARK